VIIDFHTHIFPSHIRESREEYIKRDACFSLLYSDPKARMITAEELIASMDEAEIDRSVVLNIGWVSHNLCRETNDYILETISHYPDRLTGFCMVQPQAGDKALIELERCARAGARGIGEMRSDLQGFNLADKSLLQPLADIAAKYNQIFLTHSSEPVGHQYTGKGSITPDILYSLALNFPEIKLVYAHWGGGLPLYALMPEVGRALANIFFDTAATIWLYQSSIFQHVSDIIGSDKILFGTDYPLLPQKRILQHIRSAGLALADQEKILGGNAQRLLSQEPDGDIST
jgi:predicted TIM-barrel fold metal-dependent hydrolase